MAKSRLKLLVVVAGLCWGGLVFVIAGLLGFFDLGIYWPHTYSIPSGSNAPTLLVGDYVVAWRDYYRNHSPQRGEMAVFKLPKDGKTDYIKRIVGLPGDRVQMKKGRLSIAGREVHRELQGVRQTVGFSNEIVEVSEYLETLPGGAQYAVWEESDQERYDNTPEFEVPPGHYFVLGDNRDSSLDSRAQHHLGFVPRENLRDLPTYILWANDLARIGTAVQPSP